MILLCGKNLGFSLAIAAIWVCVCLAQSVVINEIMYHPYHPVPGPEDTRQEYIEILNLGPDRVDLTGWRLADGVEFVFPSVTIAPGDFLVVAADLAVFNTLYPDVSNVVGNWTGSLKNSGERIVLLDSVGLPVDVVEYADDGDWAQRFLGPPDHGHRGWLWSDQHDGGGSSLELINPLMPNDYGQNWLASIAIGGSPGRPNSVAAANIAPLIVQVGHSPIIPTSKDQVTVRATLIDEQTGGIAASVYYRADGRAQFNAVPMLDDGLHGDGQAGDGIFAATIPNYPDKSVIEFYIYAEDSAGLSRTWPAVALVDGTEQQLTNALYLVDDWATVILAPGQQPVYHLIMTESERAELALIGSKSNGEEDSDAMMNGTFIAIEGTGTHVRYRVGIRNRGHGTRTGPPNNFHVAFLNSEPWKGLRGVNFNCRYTHAQILGSALFRLAGIAAAEAWPAQLRINGANLAVSGSPMYGCYVRLEAFNEDFAKRHFPEDSDGNLYTCFRVDGGSREADLRYEGPDPGPYRNRYFKANNQSKDDWTDLINMLEVLSLGPQESYYRQVCEVINVPQWCRYIALDALLLNCETGLNRGIGDDFFLYAGAVDKRFVLIPHDLDTILGEGNTRGEINQSIWSIVDGVSGSDGVDGLKRFFQDPDVIRHYYSSALELINTFFNNKTLDPVIDQIVSPFTPKARITAIKQFIDQRAAAVLAQIPRQFQISSENPQVGGYSRTLTGALNLHGTADATRTRSLTVNGAIATWSPRAGTWSFGEGTEVIRSLLAQGAIWRYLDDGSDLGTAWIEPEYDDSGWKSGPAQLGYGDGDEATIVGYGPSSSNKYITTYFRTGFDVSDAGRYQTLRIRLLRDDGAIVYLNGQEVIRDNMPEGQVTYTTRASSAIGGANEQMFNEFEVPGRLLRRGTNVVAVEVHQSAPNSSDMSFDLAIDGISITGSSSSTMLSPGINRLVVEAFDGPDGTGQKVHEGFIDVWYDTGRTTLVSGTLAGPQVNWTAEEGPYQISGEVIVPAGTALVIGPGTTVFFEPGSRLTVRGMLVADGTMYQQIRFTRVPLMQSTWAGIQFVDTLSDNRICWAVMEYGRTNDGMVGLTNSRLTMEHVFLDHTDLRRIRLENSSLVVRDCTFTDIFLPDQPPTTDNMSEHIWGSLAKGGQFLVESCVFGRVKGHNDCIDVDGPVRPDGVIEIRDCTFLGGGDDALDLEGDAYIEGNLFMHFHKDQYNTAAHYGNVISAGAGRQYMVVRNVFYDVDHVAQVKSGSFMTLVNNTAVNVVSSSLYFEPPGEPQSAGKGALIDSCIFWDVNEPVFDKLTRIQSLTVRNSIVPQSWASFGEGNIDAEPAFVDPNSDWNLIGGSICRNTGTFGLDMGAMVPSGPVILMRSGPWQSKAIFDVGGPGIVNYRYSLSSPDGPWSQDIPVETPIVLDGLEDGGSYTLFVLGQDWAGRLLDRNIASITWTVDKACYSLTVNEVMASKGQEDWIEIRYEGPGPVDIAGFSLTDDQAKPRKFVFGQPTILSGGQLYLISGGQLGFGLDPDGDAIYLYDRTGTLLDQVRFGPQVPGLTIARWEGKWRLAPPTPGLENKPCPQSDPRSVRINEWLTSRSGSTDEFVELYNPCDCPVDISGMILTDDPTGRAHRLRFDQLSFIPARGFLVLRPDGLDKPGHLPFKLSKDGEVLTLIGSNDNILHRVIFGPQYDGVSEGLIPDGAGAQMFIDVPSPGLSNTTGLSP